MAPEVDLAAELTLRRTDRFADVREATLAHVAEHGCGLRAPAAVEGRAAGVLVRATHSSYVLQVGAGLGYAALHVVSAFRHTGRLDLVEPDSVHAALAESQLRRHGFEERTRLHRAAAEEVLPALSGPFDLVILDGQVAPYAGLLDDVVRLLRVGGSLVAGPFPETLARGACSELLDRLAVDERLEPLFWPGVTGILATRTR